MEKNMYILSINQLNYNVREKSHATVDLVGYIFLK